MSLCISTVLCRLGAIPINSVMAVEGALEGDLGLPTPKAPPSPQHNPDFHKWPVLC